jgi:hypothetical protein
MPKQAAIVAELVKLLWVTGKDIPADIVSKHWAYPQIWHILQQILFYSGDTKESGKKRIISKNMVRIGMREVKKTEKRKC